MLTEEQVWNSDSIMAANCKAGLAMPALMQIVGAVEAEVCRAQDDRSSGLTNGRITELAMTHAHADDFARAIEAEVRAEGKDAVGWFVNVNADCDPDNPHFQQVAKQYEGDNDTLPLFIAQRPPAPCPSCADSSAEAEAYKTQWAVSCGERDALQAKVAEIEQLGERAATMVSKQADDKLRQSALIEKCETQMRKARLYVRVAIEKILDEALADIAAHKKGIAK